MCQHDEQLCALMARWSSSQFPPSEGLPGPQRHCSIPFKLHGLQHCTHLPLQDHAGENESNRQLPCTPTESSSANICQGTQERLLSKRRAGRQHRKYYCRFDALICTYLQQTICKRRGALHDNKILLHINLWYPDVTTATYLRDILYTYWKINLKNKSSETLLCSLVWPHIRFLAPH